VDVKTEKAPMVAALLAVLWAFGAPAAAGASLPLDAPASRVFKNADPFAAAPEMDLPSLTQQLRAMEERRIAASACVALCELAAGIEAHPFGVASADPLNRSEDAWGNYRFTSELETSHNRFGFTGHYWDKEASLYYAKARYYDPFTARFTQADSFLGTIDDPPSLHRYFYANDNPTFFVDPSGNAAIDYVTDGAKSVYGFGKGVAKAGYGFGAGIFQLGVKAVELDYKLKFGTLDQKREALDDMGSMVKGAGSHIAESGQLLYHGITNPGDVVAAAAQLGPEGIGEAIGGASFDTALLLAPGSKGVVVVESRVTASAGAAAAAADQTALRARVLANVEASRAARDVSGFGEFAQRTAALEEGAAARASEQAASRSRVMGALEESAASRTTASANGFKGYMAAERGISSVPNTVAEGEAVLRFNAAMADLRASAAGVSRQQGRFGTRAHVDFEGVNNGVNGATSAAGSPISFGVEEFRNINGGAASRRAGGSLGLDAVLYLKGVAIRGFDLKTGRGWTAAKIAEIERRFGVPVTEIKTR
jgi:RHS repeat-associated protein